MPPGSFGLALPVGRLFGIPLSVHWSLPALIAGIFFHDLVSLSPSLALLCLAVSVLIAGSVLLHELAHAAAASRFGLRTRAIELHAFGGVAEISGGIAAGWAAAFQDLAIALAGPASNFVLYAVFTGLARTWSGGAAEWVLGETARVNLLLGLFNLVPCFPLDGGRALVSALRMKIGPVRGDRLAYTVGIAIAVPGVIYAIVAQSPVMAIVFFVAFDACRQQRARIDASFAGARVVHPFGANGEASPGLFDWLRGLWSRSREPRPPKLRVIKGGRFEEPPDRRARN